MLIYILSSIKETHQNTFWVCVIWEIFNGIRAKKKKKLKIALSKKLFNKLRSYIDRYGVPKQVVRQPSIQKLKSASSKTLKHLTQIKEETWVLENNFFGESCYCAKTHFTHNG